MAHTWYAAMICKCADAGQHNWVSDKHTAQRRISDECGAVAACFALFFPPDFRRGLTVLLYIVVFRPWLCYFDMLKMRSVARCLADSIAKKETQHTLRKSEEKTILWFLGETYCMHHVFFFFSFLSIVGMEESGREWCKEHTYTFRTCTKCVAEKCQFSLVVRILRGPDLAWNLNCALLCAASVCTH